MEKQKKPIRVLLAKPGLDGHDKGAKIVASLLRDAGIEVIYTGIRQSLDQIVAAAIQEDVDVVALSILSGVHLGISQKIINKLKEREVESIPVVLGGVIPKADIDELKTIGIQEVFPVGSPLDNIADYFTKEKWIKENIT